MKQKNVLVTGASRGIGKSIALYFAKYGYNTIINCHSRTDLLNQVQNEILSYNVKCITHTGDIGNYNVAKELYLRAIDIFGHIDVLINNAGISYIGLLSDMTPDEWNRVIGTNLNSIYNCCSIVLPEMIKNKSGKIINISSVWGNVGASMEVAYSTTKGGMNAFTKALAKEVAPSNIQVNAIACGAIDTEMNSFLNEDELNLLIDEIPANRMGKTDEVANLAYYLANNNSYLTGQIINLDGGWI